MQSVKTKPRWLFLLAAACIMALAVAIAVYVYGGEPKPGYLTARVSRGDLETTVLATGTVEAENLVSVGAQVSGQLKSIQVKLGDTVRAGQLVAEIDSLPQQNTLRTKTAALAAVTAERQAKEASLHQAQLAYTRQMQMLQGEAASREAFESAEATLKATRAEIAMLDAQLDQARIALDTARLDLGYTRITSPIDGVVVAVVTREGQTVNASQEAPTIIKVARLDRMIIKVEISEADVVRVKPGMRVYFTILGEPDSRYPAELSAIEPAPESISSDSATSTTSSASSSSTAIYYQGILEVPNDEGKLRISMTAQVNIVLMEARNALLIPAAALGDRDQEGRFPVRVATAPGAVEERKVKIGLNDNVQAEVLEGLREGQSVVIGEQQARVAAATTTTTLRRQGPPPGMF